MVSLSSLVFVILTMLGGIHTELIAVVQVFRHGQRTPVAFYPTNPRSNLNTYWGGLDLGQLTNEGKRQHQTLGQFTRNRYSSFLPQKYNRSIVNVQTTNVDRTHMSAQTNLYGLFPAITSDQVWRKNVNWQPIPIHPSGSTSFMSSPTCTNYDTLLAEAVIDEQSVAIDTTYAALYEYLTEKSGKNITSFYNIHTVFDNMKIETDVGYSIPSWGKSVYPEPLSSLAGYFFEVYSRTTQMKRMYFGVFLNDVIEYFKNMAEDPTYSQKFQIYSGHDTNIAGILNCFGAFDTPYPPEFASTIYMELHLENWVNVVKVYSKNGDNLTQISVNGCDLNCPLSQFRDVLSHIIADEDTIAAECKATITTIASSRFEAVSKTITLEQVKQEYKEFTKSFV